MKNRSRGKFFLWSNVKSSLKEFNEKFVSEKKSSDFQSRSSKRPRCSSSVMPRAKRLKCEVETDGTDLMGRRLLDACETNDVAEVKELLSSGAVDVNCRRETDGSSGLHLASLHRHEQLLEVLLAHTGVEVNLTDLSDRTPLITACMAGHHDVVRRLCRAPGIDLNCKDSDGLAALHYAVKFNPQSARCVEVRVIFQTEIFFLSELFLCRS